MCMLLFLNVVSLQCEHLFDFDLEADVNNEVQLKYLGYRGDYCRMSEALLRVD